MSYFKALISDPLFFRVCMLLWGVPFLVLSGYALIAWRPAEAFEWVAYVLVGAIGALGAYLALCALFGSERSVDKAADFMGDGGDIVGFIAAAVVCMVALPLVAAIRVFWPRQHADS